MLSDLTARFGEAWCVTLAPRAVGKALEGVGVVAPAELADGLARVTERLEVGYGSRADVLLIGRQVAEGWTLVLEVEGSTGWVGLAPGVLAGLSHDDQMAACARADPNQIDVHFAGEDGSVARLDVVTGLRIGDFGEQLAGALTTVGFPAGDAAEFSGVAAGLGFAQRALLALEAATGVGLTDEMFSGPWAGGTSAL
jgi:hypothetical protein